MRYKQLIGDVVLSVVASCVPLVLLQLAILPLVAGRLSEDEYGLVVTLIALLSLCPGTVGNVLNNIRLMDGKANVGRTFPANYSFVMVAFTVLSAIVTAVIAYLYVKRLSISVVGMGVLAALTVVREYLVVAYRIKLNYRFILINNVFLAVGYLVGFVLFLLVGRWELIYLCGLTLSLCFILKTTSLWREPISIDKDLALLVKDNGILLGSSILGKSTAYADRMVIFPLLGGVETSVYYVATLFGKVLSMGVSPLNSVILSYLSRLSSKPQKAFWRSLAICAILSVVGYVVTMLIARPLLGFLYPQFVNEAMVYVGVVTITAYVGVLISVADPYVLRFFPLKWQIIENGGFGLLYFTLALALMGHYGLMGFCVGALIASAVKLIFLIFLYCNGKEKVV